MPSEVTIPGEGEGTEPSSGQEINPMAEMLKDYLPDQRLKPGEVVPGVVVRVGSNDIIVDVGAKCEGIVPAHDLEKLSPEELEVIQEEDEVLVYVVTPEDKDGNVILSLSRAQIAREWSRAQRLLEDQEIVESQVIGYNKGGVIVRLGKLRGFVPGSHLNTSPFLDQLASAGRRSERSLEGTTQSDGDDRWSPLLGNTLRLKLIEVDQERNRLILSERAALRDWRKNQREKLLNELKEGDVRQGRVTNLVDFGAFVDLGGIDGLVHISELSWKRIMHPREVVEVGQEVEVYVLGVDRERQRVALSLKRLQPDPWTSIEERYEEGQLVEGTITRLTKWGAFASIVGDEAIEGLIHVSELDEGQVVHPRDVVQPGQVVTLRVLSIDEDRHRMALSLKQASQEAYLEQDWRRVLKTEQSKPDSPLSAALTTGPESQSPESEERPGSGE